MPATPLGSAAVMSSNSPKQIAAANSAAVSTARLARVVARVVATAARVNRCGARVLMGVDPDTGSWARAGPGIRVRRPRPVPSATAPGGAGAGPDAPARSALPGEPVIARRPTETAEA